MYQSWRQLHISEQQFLDARPYLIKWDSQQDNGRKRQQHRNYKRDKASEIDRDEPNGINIRHYPVEIGCGREVGPLESFACRRAVL